ncbi:hypothetical protein AMTRI_Chr09g32510 [Amborella trichopoda]
MASTYLRRRAVVCVHHYCTYVSQSKNPQTTLTFNSANIKLGLDICRTLQLGSSPKTQCFSEIEILLENQKKNPKIKSENFLHGLLISYGQAKMVGQAIKLFYQMDKLEIPCSVDSFNAVLTACKDAGILKSYSILIKSICEMGSPKLTYQKLEEMEERQMEVTTIIYTILINVLYKSNNSEKAEKIWDEMAKVGCSPDAAAYNPRVSYIDESNCRNGSFRCYAQCHHLQFAPDVLQNGEIEGPHRTFKEMEKKGSSPNDFSFTRITGVLLKCFEDCVSKKKAPDFEALGLLEEAKEIIKLVKDTYPEQTVRERREGRAYGGELGLRI